MVRHAVRSMLATIACCCLVLTPSAGFAAVSLTAGAGSAQFVGESAKSYTHGATFQLEARAGTTRGDGWVLLGAYERHDRMAGVLPALQFTSDGQLASHRHFAHLDFDPGSDGVAVGTGLGEAEPQPVTHLR